MPAERRRCPKPQQRTSSAPSSIVVPSGPGGSLPKSPAFSRPVSVGAAGGGRRGSNARGPHPMSPAKGSTRPSSASSFTPSSRHRPQRKFEEYPIVGKEATYVFADVKGRVRRPKLQKDEVKLRELCRYCREGNFREARAIAVHFPHLLSLTDEHGFGPLHHAEMSGNAWFVAQLLKLYTNPRTFAFKVVRYNTEEEMWRDESEGFQLHRIAGVSAKNTKQAYTVLVEQVGRGTMAAIAGLMPGDVLEAIRGETLLGSRMPPPDAENIFSALRSEDWQFPLILEFRGSALTQLLGKDGWTPCHGAAGHGETEQRSSILAQLLSADAGAPVARDVCGCTPLNLYQLSNGAVSVNRHMKGNRRRPLSAGPRGVMLARDFQQGALSHEQAMMRPPSTTTGSRPASAARSSVKSCSRPTSAASARTFSLEGGVASAWAARVTAEALEFAEDRDVFDIDIDDVGDAPAPCDVPEFPDFGTRTRELPTDVFLLDCATAST